MPRDPRPPAPPSYTPDFDGFACPEFDAEPAFLHETVVINLEGDVQRGQLRVAHVLVQSTLNNGSGTEFALLTRWITENQAADDDARTWRRRWWDDLVTHPQVAQAMEQGPDELLARAGLSVAEHIAMRYTLETDADGEPLSTRAIALKLGAPESTIRARLERAKAALQRLGAATQPVAALA